METSTTPTNPTVVVVTEEKKRRRGLLWFSAATAALMIGGSTFALWSASASIVPGDKINNGDLNLTASAATQLYDVSPDRTDGAVTILPGITGSPKGHTIDSTTWNMVPGDKIAAVLSADVTLTGDNMVAKLSITDLPDEAGVGSNLEWSYQVYKGNVEITSGEIAGGQAALYRSAMDGADDTNLPSVVQMTQATENYTVVVFGTFDGATPDRELAGIAHDLKNVRLQLDQVRDTGANFQ
jgi:alternate signal-mediated exported protein